MAERFCDNQDSLPQQLGAADHYLPAPLPRWGGSSHSGRLVTTCHGGQFPHIPGDRFIDRRECSYYLGVGLRWLSVAPLLLQVAVPTTATGGTCET